MDCEADSQGSVSFRVVSPESISGITGSVDRDQGKLTFDDKALAFDLLADGQLSPVSAPWVMIHTLRGGYLSSCAESGDGMLLLNISNGLKCRQDGAEAFSNFFGGSVTVDYCDEIKMQFEEPEAPEEVNVNE
jgi:hypothetical protein